MCCHRGAVSLDRNTVRQVHALRFCGGLPGIFCSFSFRSRLSNTVGMDSDGVQRQHATASDCGELARRQRL